MNHSTTYFPILSTKEQVNLHIRERREKKPLTPPYPAVTLVLYFGDASKDAPKDASKDEKKRWC